MNLEIQSLGGKATAIKLRKEALERYYANPNKCLFCGKIIEVPEDGKVCQIKIKKFCNRSCGGFYNNKLRHPKEKKVKTRICKKCGNIFVNEYQKKYCLECQEQGLLSFKTKGELFRLRKNWQSARSIIVHHAAKTYKKSDKPKKCLKCGYDKHYEICHKKTVSSFPDEALIKEINHIDNLLAFCPTHHWEFDNGFLNEYK
jgi:hypothetical protein